MDAFGTEPLAVGASVVTTARLERSLQRQATILRSSLILTPVDNFPLSPSGDSSFEFLKGLYASDKQRNDDQKKLSNIQFSGRERITYDLNLIHGEFARRLRADAASLRLLSGLHAHVTVFMGMAAIGDRVLLLSEAGGGHFATKGILERLGLSVIETPIDHARLCVDRQATLELARAHPPQFVLIDRSEGLKYENFEWVQEIEGIKIFDSSQYLPQIMRSDYTNPFDWGFDLQLFSLHKSFPGPQKAGAAARCAESIAWRRYLAGVSAYVSSSHIENSYAAGYALADWERLNAYGERLVPVAVELERALISRGVPMMPRKLQGQADWPDTQHLWMRCADRDQAYAAWQALARVRIQTNYRKLPYDLGWGLRLGTTAAVMRGLTVDATEGVADVIASALIEGPSPTLRRKVRGIAEHLGEGAISRWP